MQPLLQSYRLNCRMASNADAEERRLLDQVLERQKTLQDLSAKERKVRKEVKDLREENAVLREYIENLTSSGSGSGLSAAASDSTKASPGEKKRPGSR